MKNNIVSHRRVELERDLEMVVVEIVCTNAPNIQITILLRKDPYEVI